MEKKQTRDSNKQTPKMEILTFATSSDHEICRRLHREHGSQPYFVTRWLSSSSKLRIDAIFGFVHLVHEWVANPYFLPKIELLDRFKDWRQQLMSATKGFPPTHPVLRAFADVVQICRIPLQEPLLFLDAMETDIQQTRYTTYSELQKHIRGRASSVGVMLCYALDIPRHPMSIEAAIALGEAIQLSSFLCNIGTDAKRGRIYIPQEDLELFKATETDIFRGYPSENFKSLMRFEILKARKAFLKANEGIPFLPKKIKITVSATRSLHLRMLRAIEQQDYDVFSQKIHITFMQQLGIFIGAIFTKPVYQVPAIKEE